jgi:replication initiator protein A
LGEGSPLYEGGTDSELLGEDYSALILVEANLEVPPTFKLRRTNPTRRVAEFSNTLVNEGGERVQQHWRISVPEPYELPGPFDQDVWVAVQTLVGTRGGMPPDGRLYFSLYELLGVMRKARKGDNYKELRASLLRLSATHFQADNAFYLKDKNKLATRTFTLWDVSLDTEVNNETGEATERHFLEFHNVVRQSFQAEYLKTLDSDFYFSLRSPLAKRLYRLIDRKRQGKQRWGTSLNKLKDMAPLAPSYKTPSKIRDVLETAHGELQRRGFLAGVSYEKRNGSHWVRWRVEPEFDRRRSLKAWDGGLALDAGPTEEERRAVALLVDRGVWANVARDLVRRHGPEICGLQVKSLPFQRGVTDPPAWLRWAIETDHPLPNHLRPQPSLMDEGDPDRGPSSPTRTNGAAPGSSRQGDPESNAASCELEEDVRRRHEEGEFDAAIGAFETAAFEQYTKHVATNAPVRADDTENRYYVSLDGDLYLCLGGSTYEEHLVRICALKREVVEYE